MHRTPITSFPLAHWTSHAIDQECGTAYHRYEKARRQQYVDYFTRYPELRCRQHGHSAKSLAAALPSGWDDLQTLIPRNAWHVHARSGKSSQTLALALLGCATRLDPSFGWFWRAFDLPAPVSTQLPPVAFERQLPSSLLNEKPRATVLDFVVDDPGCFVAVETKWTEPGFGTCSCAPSGTGDPCPGGHCAERIIRREHYWRVAERFFGLPAWRLPLFGCPISPLYQVIRNVAAAEQLANGERPFAFAMIYDAENPYFRPGKIWPGWPALLQAHLENHEAHGFRFRARSWQELARVIPMDEPVRQWAQEKHGLG